MQSGASHAVIGRHSTLPLTQNHKNQPQSSPGSHSKIFAAGPLVPRPLRLPQHATRAEGTPQLNGRVTDVADSESSAADVVEFSPTGSLPSSEIMSKLRASTGEFTIIRRPSEEVEWVARGVSAQ
jgi:hypothetical protein